MGGGGFSGKGGVAGLLTLAMMGGAAMGQTAPLAVPVISFVTIAGQLQIQGSVQGHAEGEIAARLEVRRTGPSGSVNSQQGRTIPVSPGSEDTIATMQISVDPGSTVDVIMVLEADGAEITRVRQTLTHQP